jgi:hypothetical protein
MILHITGGEAPGTLVIVARPLSPLRVTMQPPFISSWPLKMSVLGWWPIAMKHPMRAS